MKRVSLSLLVFLLLFSSYACVYSSAEGYFIQSTNSSDYIKYNFDFVHGVPEVNNVPFYYLKNDVENTLDKQYIIENEDDHITTCYPMKIGETPVSAQLYIFTYGLLDKYVLIFDLKDVDLKSVCSYYYSHYGLPSNYQDFIDNKAITQDWYGNAYSGKLLLPSVGDYVYMEYTAKNTSPDIKKTNLEKIDCFDLRSKLGSSISEILLPNMKENVDYIFTKGEKQSVFSFPNRYTFYPSFDYMGIPSPYNTVELTTPYESDLIDTINYISYWPDKSNTFSLSQITQNMIDTIDEAFGKSAIYETIAETVNRNATRDEFMMYVARGINGLYVANWENTGCSLGVSISEEYDYIKVTIGFSGKKNSSDSSSSYDNKYATNKPDDDLKYLDISGGKTNSAFSLPDDYEFDYYLMDITVADLLNMYESVRSNIVKGAPIIRNPHIIKASNGDYKLSYDDDEDIAMNVYCKLESKNTLEVPINMITLYLKDNTTANIRACLTVFSDNEDKHLIDRLLDFYDKNECKANDCSAALVTSEGYLIRYFINSLGYKVFNVFNIKPY